MSAVRAPRTATVSLYQGDDYERLAEAYQLWRVRVAEAPDKPSETAREGDLSDVTKARQDYEKVRAEVEANGTEVRMRAVGKNKWRKMLAEHAPREGDKLDENVGYNRDTFVPTVVDVCLVEIHVDGEIKKLSGAEREEWLDDLSDGEEAALFDAALGLNQNRPIDPKALSLAAG